MVKHLLNCSVHVAAAALCQGAAVSSTNASSFTGGWAVRDMQTLMLMEQCESGQVGDRQPGGSPEKSILKINPPDQLPVLKYCREGTSLQSVIN
jgi:hypothetical protein